MRRNMDATKGDMRGGINVTSTVGAGLHLSVTAKNQLWLNPMDGGTYISPIVLTASNSFTLTTSSQLATNFWEVTGSTSFRVTNSPVTFVLNSTYSVSASNSLTFNTSVTGPITTNLSASNSYTFTVGGSNTMVFNVSANNSFNVTNYPGGIINQFYALSANASWTFTVTADTTGSTFGGATAQNSLTFTTIAFARVVLPWQRSTPSLPPGGQLPHS